MNLNTLGDEKFKAHYEMNNPPQWFSIVGHTLLFILQAIVLYFIAKFVSIETAFIVYVVFAGILKGWDGMVIQKIEI